MFLFYFKEASINYDMPIRTDDEKLLCLKVHKQKLMNLCWLQAQLDYNLEKNERRRELLAKKIESLSIFMKMVFATLPKEKRSYFWMLTNLDKNKNF